MTSLYSPMDHRSNSTCPSPHSPKKSPNPYHISKEVIQLYDVKLSKEPEPVHLPTLRPRAEYYDTPTARHRLRLLSCEATLDDVVQHGFPCNRTMTMRVTLTPWHGRADDRDIYGDESEKKESLFLRRARARWERKHRPNEH
ncbi:hypothetical protein VKS41_005980 [Umbelopsis sp. WA50703]|jgi:hypothetical protein